MKRSKEEVLLEDIYSIEHRIAGASVALSALKVEKGRLLTELRTLVDSGGTTGEPIQDYILSQFGLLESSWVERYRLLNQELYGHSGEAMLLVYEKKVQLVFNVMASPRDRNYEMQTHCILAVLEGGELVFDRGADNKMQCRLPVRSFAMRKGWEADLQIVHEPLVEEPSRLFFPQAPTPPMKEGWHPRSETIHRLIVGNKAVRKWFEEQFSYRDILQNGMLESYLERLGQLQLTSPIETVEG